MRTAAVEQACDVGMAQVGQDLAFPAEALRKSRGIEAATHDLDGDRLLIFRVGPHGPIDGAHAALADDLDDAVVTENLPHPGSASRLVEPGFRLQRGTLPERQTLRRLVASQQTFNRRLEHLIARARLRQKGVALRGR